MSKILIEVILPATGNHYDVYIHPDNKVGDVLLMLSKAMTELSKGTFIADNKTVLCDADCGQVLDVNMHFADLGIENGARVMLI